MSLKHMNKKIDPSSFNNSGYYLGPAISEAKIQLFEDESKKKSQACSRCLAVCSMIVTGALIYLGIAYYRSIYRQSKHEL